uniref:Natterin-3 n=1 Tax=Fundulus heteroclitus TaxID=8078 RepID=A0A3Q2QYW1_FUNHE
MLPLLLLLLLSAASLQDHMENRPLDGKASSLDPDLKNGVAKIQMNVSVSTVRRRLPPSKFRLKSPHDSTPSSFDSKHWVKWQGFLPNGAVSIYNAYSERTDYVCKVRCHSGFYNPSIGPYCHYPYKKAEHISSSFQILVNEGNLEIFEWKEDSYGSVPKNSVRTCSSEEIYVGKNKYGLGMVYPKDRCFYLPWEGSEYWYQKNYEVLTNMMTEKEIISDVKYSTDQTKMFKEPPKTLKTSTAVNNALSCVKKRVTLTQTTKDERHWDISSSIRTGLRKSIRTGIPSIVEGNIELSAEMTHTFSGGNSWIEEVSHSVTLELNVPPKHSCQVKLVGYRYKMDIPYSAKLSRTYEDGETRSVTITGTYHGLQTGEVRAEVEQCKPLSGSMLFPEMR